VTCFLNSFPKDSPKNKIQLVHHHHYYFRFSFASVVIFCAKNHGSVTHLPRTFRELFPVAGTTEIWGISAVLKKGTVRALSTTEIGLVESPFDIHHDE
jgi:hypothetical protein